MESYQIEMTAADLAVAEVALKEMERHQQGVADEVYGQGGITPDVRLCSEYLARADAARRALLKLRAR